MTLTLCDFCKPYWGIDPPRPWAYRMLPDGRGACRKHFDEWAANELAATSAGVAAANEAGVTHRTVDA